MKILVVSNSMDEPSQGWSLLDQDFPDSERRQVADEESLLQALQHESPDVVIVPYRLNWLTRPDLIQLIHQHQPGISVILASDSPSPQPCNFEGALDQYFQTFETLLNLHSNFILLLDLQRKVLLANQTFLKHNRKNLNEVRGLTLFDLLPTPLAGQLDALLRQALETGETLHCEGQGVNGWSGEITISPLAHSPGQITHAMVHTRDITSQKDLEETLRRDQQIMLAMANAPKSIFLVLDRAGTILMTNEVMARSFERQVDELIGTCFWDILPEPVAKFRRSIFNHVMQTGIAERVEDPGRFGIYDSWVIPIPDVHGEIREIVIFATDITDRKKMELAVLESEQRYRTLIEISPNGIIYYDLEDATEPRPLIVNQRFAELFGYENAAEVIRLGVTESDLVAEQDQERLKAIIQAGLQDGYVRDEIITGRRKDGSTFILEANGAMVYHQNGKPQGFFGVCRDVTERIRIQQELVRAHETLEQRVFERTAELHTLNRQFQREISLRKEAEDKWKRHAMHSEALARVASSANAYLDLDSVLESICDEVIRAIPYSICSISLYREEDDSLYIAGYASKVTTNLNTIPPSPRPQFEEQVRRLGNLIILPDVAMFPDAAYLSTAATPNIRTLVIMPFYHKGELIGSLSLASTGEIRLPTEDELDLLRAITDQAALSITNTKLFTRISESQARLKFLTERLVEVQEEERRRLARELHDEIGQMLTSLSLNLEIISRSVRAGEAESNVQFELERLRWQVKQLLDEVRDLSFNLLPSMLDDLGLLPALLDHCQRFTAQTGIVVNLSHRGLEERVSPQVEISAYRIVQEALTNVARHARVNQVDVRLWASSQVLGVQIEDQGRGFDLQKIEGAYKSHGIAGMRERAANCGGNLEIDTSLGKGVCLTAEFPLASSD